MFNVIVVNLTPDARSAIEGGGPVDLGQLSAGELGALLDVFAELDPIQNLKADSEIRVQTRRDRYFIRTGERKLFLYDSRKPSDPAYVLSSSEIIAELDGTAAARRTVPPIPMSRLTGSETRADAANAPVAEVAAPPIEQRRSGAIPLLALAALLGGYIAYSGWTVRDSAATPPLTDLSPSDRIAEDLALTGVYMTGSEPGHYGIVILGDGKLKLFQVNAQAAPGVVYGTYRLGRLSAKVCLATDQPGGLIVVAERNTLEFCGEKYTRIP